MNFWTLLEQSTITSGLIALVLVGTACYLSAMGQEIPEPLTIALGVVVGFFFSDKASKANLSNAKVQMLKDHGQDQVVSKNVSKG